LYNRFDFHVERFEKPDLFLILWLSMYILERRPMTTAEQYAYFLDEHKELFLRLDEIRPSVVKAGLLIIESLKRNNKVLVCGNGGSASDAQHLAAELIGRFEKERRALPAISLSTDTSILTALSNDYGYDTVFSRQVEGLSVVGDVVIGISTSGNSKNVIFAMKSAKDKGVKSIGLLGRNGGELASLVDIPVIVPHQVTARIQEAHIFIIHFWAALIEKQLFAS
jgi:D-sedoheptulose 7-phosphate isomerase